MDLTIRKMKEDDFEALYELLSDSRVMRYLEAPYTREKTERFLVNAGLSDPPLVYAADKDGTMIGYVVFHAYDDTGMEIGWVLHPRYWGNGYATHLTKLLIEKTLDLGRQPVIECVPEQEATKHIALKHGFEYEGRKDGLEIFRFKESTKRNTQIKESCKE